MSEFDASGCQKGFIVSTESWWHDHVGFARQPDLVEEVTFGLYHPEGGTMGEMVMRWYHLGNEVVARLEAFNDSWAALYTFGPEFLKVLNRYGTLCWSRQGLESYMTPAEFRRELVDLGFADMTMRARPGTLEGAEGSPPWGLVRELERLQKQMLTGDAKAAAAEVEGLRRHIAADTWNAAVALVGTRSGGQSS